MSHRPISIAFSVPDRRTNAKTLWAKSLAWLAEKRRARPDVPTVTLRYTGGIVLFERGVV